MRTVGNGALLGGIGLALGRRSLGTARVGAVPKEGPVMALSWRAGRGVEAVSRPSFADGLLARCREEPESFPE